MGDGGGPTAALSDAWAADSEGPPGSAGEPRRMLMERLDFSRPFAGALPETPPRTRLFQLWKTGELGLELSASRDDPLASSRSRSSALGAVGRAVGVRSGRAPGATARSARGRRPSGVVGSERGPLQPQGSLYSCDSMQLSQTWSSESIERASLSLNGSLTERSRGRFGGAGGDDTVDYYGAFKDACLRKYSTLCRTWRLLIDPKGVGRVPFAAFCLAARSIGFGDVRQLWAALDVNQSGFITMDEWDPVSFHNLVEFREICRVHYGSLEAAFSLGLDRSKSCTVTFAELQQFCEEKDFLGDTRVLFHALDLHQRGFITVDELAFLSRFQGERFYKAPKNRGFGRTSLGFGEVPRIPRGPLSPGQKRQQQLRQTLPSLGEKQWRPAKDSNPLRWAY